MADDVVIEKKHRELRPADGVHALHAFECANRTARNNLLIGPLDVGKVALELDSTTFWVVRSANPTIWAPVGGRAAFTFVQAEASATWVLEHGLGYRPNITLCDADGNEVEAHIRHDSTDRATVSFSAPYIGSATAT